MFTVVPFHFTPLALHVVDPHCPALFFSLVDAHNDTTFCLPVIIIREHAVAQLVEALHYKPEGRGFDSRWCHFIDIILPGALWSWG